MNVTVGFTKSLMHTNMTAGKGAEVVFVLIVYFKTIVRKSFKNHLKSERQHLGARGYYLYSSVESLCFYVTVSKVKPS